MITLDRVTVHQGALVLAEISLHIDSREHAVLMGKTGAGKTTLLEVICGLRPLQQGRILIGGEDVTAAAPGDRGIGYVPQDGALFTAMTAGENIGYALRVRGWSRTATAQRVRDVAALVRIPTLLDRRPATLSGGEKQRVALARALAAWPEVLCLDEPLSALDAETREEMMALLREIRREAGVTILHVTHSLGEAHALATTLLRLEEGRVLPVSQDTVKSGA